MRRIIMIVGPVLCSALVFTGATPAQGTSLAVSARYQDRDNARGWLGVSIQDVTTKFAKSKDLSVESGAYVSDVQRDSPADSTGIHEGDVITEFNGQTIADSYDLQRAVRKVDPGTKVKVKLVRKKESKTLDVRVGSEPARARRMAVVAPRRMPRFQFFGESNLAGLQLMELNEQLAKYFETPEGSGVLVKSVEKGSDAEKAGFKAGDVIIRIGNRQIDDVRDVTRVLRSYDKGEKADVDVIRKAKRQTLSLEVTRDLSENTYEFWVDPDRDGDEQRYFRFKMSPNEHWGGSNFDYKLPDMGEIEIELEKLHEHLRDLGPEIRERMERVMPEIKIRTRVLRSI